MAPHDLRRPFKRPTISDQQKRREISLLRQAQHRRDAQQQARCLASSVLSLENPTPSSELIDEAQEHAIEEEEKREFDVAQASRLKGPEARKWFAKQLMIPEWMIDLPDRLNHDWYVFARPAGKRCFVVSSKGTTVSRLRNGAVLHHFPSALPCGSRKKTVSDPSQSYSVLDCIFHELSSDFFWMNSKLAETGACGPPSTYHKYRFSQVPVYNCDESGLQMAYYGAVPYVKDGLLLYNKHAHYQTGNTPLVLVWKDENCSQYVIDTDSNGHVPIQQQSGLQSGCLLRFSIRDRGLVIVNGKLEKADLEYLGKSNRVRAFADSYSKVVSN